ncbi:JAB domain-containing protein [Pedobacter sp. N23S346]|uniref:JAB domain-containing protein n=1 Tax=Pedobacter sp. N23S346 TaxID=3402750 RepID=UPI003AD6B414
MPNQKKQFESAELEFRFQSLNEVIFSTENALIATLVHQLHGKTLSNTAAFYALFVNLQNEVFCWYNLRNISDTDRVTQQVVGLAIACNAAGVILVQSHLEKTTFNTFDRLLVLSIFETLELRGLDFLDYLICDNNTFSSFKKTQFVN